MAVDEDGHRRGLAAAVLRDGEPEVDALVPREGRARLGVEAPDLIGQRELRLAVRLEAGKELRRVDGAERVEVDEAEPLQEELIPRRGAACAEQREEVAREGGELLARDDLHVLAAHGRCVHQVERRGELSRETRERAESVEPVTHRHEVVRHRLGGEAPGEGHVVERELQLGQAALERSERAGLHQVVHRGERRPHRLAIRALEILGEHHRVGGLLAQRNHRLGDEGIGLPLVEGNHAVIGGAAGIGVVEHAVHVGVLAGVEHAIVVRVLLGLFKRQLPQARVRLVGVVVRVVEQERRVALSEVERHRLAEVGRSRRDVHHQDGIVARIEAIKPVALDDVLGVERRIKRQGDRRERAPPVELVEAAAHLLLPDGGRDDAGVEAQVGRRGRVAAGGDVVGERDLGERPAGEVEVHLGARAWERGAQAFGHRLAAGGEEGAGGGAEVRGACERSAARGDADAVVHRRAAPERLTVARWRKRKCPHRVPSGRGCASGRMEELASFSVPARPTS